MEVVSGRSILNGIAIGMLRVVHRTEIHVQKLSTHDPDWELERFDQARQESYDQLDALCRKTRRKVGRDAAAIFEVHQVMLEDEDILNTVRKLLETGVTAQYAVSSAGKVFSALFERLEDGYMRARASDVRDVANRILHNLSGVPLDGLLEEGEEAILAVDDLFPSEIAGLDRERLLGFITRRGSCLSHTSILSRAMEIPSMVEMDYDESWDGKMAALDGDMGIFYAEPTLELLGALAARKAR